MTGPGAAGTGGSRLFSEGVFEQASGPLDMYADGTQTSGRFLHNVGSTSFFSSSSSSHCSAAASPCPCRHYVQREPPPYRQQMGFSPPSCELVEVDAGWRASAAGAEALSPQRRPVLQAPGPCSRPEVRTQSCSWESHPAQWPGDRQYPSVREHCSCVACRSRPHPPPHPRVKGQGYRHKRTVRYVAVEEEEGCGFLSEDNHSGCCEARVSHLYVANGHCGPSRRFSEEEARQDGHREGCGRCCDGAAAAAAITYQGFFPTEVPQKQLVPNRLKELHVPPHSSSSTTVTVPQAARLPSTTNREHLGQGSEVVLQRAAAGGKRRRRRRDMVREQIRRVVSDLEDVLGGLKQVHVEMKEVVHEIDRLTAGINLSEDAAPLAQEEATPSNPYSNHADELLPALPHAREDRIVLRTNSPSLVHTAAVVKTSLFNQANHSNGANHAPGMNGHPPQLHPASDSDPRPQCLDPKVIVWNGTSSPRTQKPPRYPQNGRCGKSPHSPPLPARTPWHPGSGRQNGSMV